MDPTTNIVRIQLPISELLKLLIVYAATVTQDEDSVALDCWLLRVSGDGGSAVRATDCCTGRKRNNVDDVTGIETRYGT
jgi:hypothetical protein